MAQLVLYYSLGGKTKAVAEAFAKERSLDIRAIVPQKKISKLNAILLCPKAVSGGGVPVKIIDADFGSYELIHIFAPIWAGSPAPPVNTVLGRLPGGTEVEFTFVSSSGNSNKAFKVRGDLKIRSINNVKN